jgi:RecJ-like exonuclease
VAKSKGLSDISTLAYVTKVTRSIAPVVGDTFASTIAFAAYGKWSDRTMFRTVAQNVYKDIAEKLAKPKPGEIIDYTRYLSLAMALAAEFQKFWLKFPEGVPEDKLKLIAYLWHVEPRKRFPYDKALEIAKILNEAFTRLKGEKGA